MWARIDELDKFVSARSAKSPRWLRQWGEPGNYPDYVVNAMHERLSVYRPSKREVEHDFTVDIGEGVKKYDTEIDLRDGPDSIRMWAIQGNCILYAMIAAKALRHNKVAAIFNRGGEFVHFGVVTGEGGWLDFDGEDDLDAVSESWDGERVEVFDLGSEADCDRLTVGIGLLELDNFRRSLGPLSYAMCRWAIEKDFGSAGEGSVSVS